MKSDKLLAAEVLEAASMVVAVPDWWAQGATAYAAKDSLGAGYAPVDPSDRHAVCFCAVGAMLAAAYEVEDDDSLNVLRLARNAVDLQTVRAGLTLWNDRKGRTPQQVAELLWNAAQELRNEHS